MPLRPVTPNITRQRATAGLIITEATQITPQGQGYAYTPGIHSEAQVAGWKKVTDAVHARGGRIFLQLWHVGRISHPDLQQDGGAGGASAPSSRRQDLYRGRASPPFVTPRALELDEIPGVIEDYRQRRRTRCGPASTAWRSTAPMATCSTSSCATAPTTAPTPMADRSRTAPGCCWK